MNKSKIEWTDYSWNPITGCYHPCPYCYARKQSARFAGDVRLNTTDQRCQKITHGEKQLYVLEEPFILRNNRAVAFPFGFAPTFHTYRLDWPQKVKNGANIFVGSMADVFGEWVPDEWIERIFDACDKAPQHNYIFLTKNPKRYIELAEKKLLRTGDNYWYGSSTPTPETEFFFHDQVNTFVSIEPILAPFTELTDANGVAKKVDWVIIGAETGNRKAKVKPEFDWIKEIVLSADSAGVPVFMKDSLIAIVGEKNMRRDFPKKLTRKVLSDKLQNKLYSHCGKCKNEFKKSDMQAILSREKRGDGAKAIGYICKNCFSDFEKGFEHNGNTDEQ